MIIIEGMDGSGKTTLFTQLARTLSTVSVFRDVLLIPSRGIPENSDDVALRLVEENQNSQIRRMITDRSDLISDFVYGGINSSRRSVDLATIKTVFTSHPTLFIYCDPLHGEDPSDLESPNRIFHDRWFENIRRKYFKSSPMRFPKTFEMVQGRYFDVTQYGLKPDLSYNWQRDNIETVWTAVKEYLLG